MWIAFWIRLRWEYDLISKSKTAEDELQEWYVFWRRLKTTVEVVSFNVVVVMRFCARVCAELKR